MNKLIRASSIAAVAFVAAGCVVTPPPVALTPRDVPTSFSQPIASNAPVWPKPGWWEGFGSSELDSLIVEAHQNNLDLASAVAGVMQARAQTYISASALFPSLSASATASRSSTTAQGFNLTRNDFGLSGSASYEASFWDTLPNLQSAQEALKAARFNQQTVALTVTASVANTYLDVLALRQRETIADQNIQAANRILSITEAKVTNGVSSRLDLAQQEALVNGEKAQVPALQEQSNEARFALAVLLGRTPEGFKVAGQNLDGIKAPTVAPGLPSELLERRPDVAQAEAQLAAAHANVDAARNAFFPQINLTASGGYASTALSSLVNPSNLGFSLGASLVQSIFSGGRHSGELELSKAQQLQLIEAYRGSVLNAFKDVETALSQVAHYAQEEKYTTAQVKAAAEAFRISEIQYREGVADLLTVLQSQQTLFSAEDTLVQIKLARIQADIGLYRALGGGWSENPADMTQPVAIPANLPKTAAPAVNAAKKAKKDQKNRGILDWLF
ncbi:MAG: efflux transporter outer membrane subunit [Alphaproteobacteria bacterium]|nr:efflux transporter outer membrane subunit [Alphaproteobacteria bacterium]